jgi:hypothetical protein
MSDKLNKMNFSQKTAFVYGGAALLILVVGARSILLTSDDFGALSFFTIGAIILETILLFIYANAIYNQSDDKQEEETLSVNLDVSGLETQISTLNDSIGQLNTSISKVETIDKEWTIDTAEFENISDGLNESLVSLKAEMTDFNYFSDTLSNKLTEVVDGVLANNDKIDKVLNRQINEEIKSEIRNLLEKSLANED